METTKLTPVEKRMLTVLADGADHTKEELHACLSDDLGPLGNIAAHLTGLRKKLRPSGQDIVPVSRGNKRKALYRQVRLLKSPAE